MVAHVKRCHSQAVKRKAEAHEELARMELLHAGKVPRLTVDEQTGGAMTTRGTKRAADDDISTGKVSKPLVDYSDTSDEEEEGEDEKPLFQANIAKMGTPKKWKKGKVIDQKFTFTSTIHVTQNQTKIWAWKLFRH